MSESGKVLSLMTCYPSSLVPQPKRLPKMYLEQTLVHKDAHVVRIGKCIVPHGSRPYYGKVTVCISTELVQKRFTKIQVV